VKREGERSVKASAKRTRREDGGKKTVRPGKFTLQRRRKCAKSESGGEKTTDGATEPGCSFKREKHGDYLFKALSGEGQALSLSVIVGKRLT